MKEQEMGVSNPSFKTEKQPDGVVGVETSSFVADPQGHHQPYMYGFFFPRKVQYYINCHLLDGNTASFVLCRACA